MASMHLQHVRACKQHKFAAPSKVYSSNALPNCAKSMGSADSHSNLLLSAVLARAVEGGSGDIDVAISFPANNQSRVLGDSHPITR